MSTNHQVRAAVAAALSDPEKVCAGLGLMERAERQSRGVSILCPWHNEKDPSCSVTRGARGGIRVRCHACGASGDVFKLIAQVLGLDCRGRNFIEVLRRGCEIGGLHTEIESLDAESRGREEKERVTETRKRKSTWTPPEAVAVDELEPVSYPPPQELALLWDTCEPLATADPEAQNYVRGRGIDLERCPGRVIGRPLGELDARRRRDESSGVITSLVGRVELTTTMLPRWARWKGKEGIRAESVSWAESGHRIILCTFDARGVWRSVRAIQLDSRYAVDAPKRLPPGGYSCAGLVLATPSAVQMLRGKNREPQQVVIVEGEPDWMTWAARAPNVAVLGIFSGAWTKQHADAIPDGSTVVIRVHQDDAGDRYAADLGRTLKGRELRILRA